MTRRLAGQGNAKRTKSVTSNNKYKNDSSNDDEKVNKQEKYDEPITEESSESMIQNEQQQQEEEKQENVISNNNINVSNNDNNNETNADSIALQIIKNIYSSSDNLISEECRESNQVQNYEEKEHEQYKQEQEAAKTTESTTNITTQCLDDNIVADKHIKYNEDDNEQEERHDNSTALQSYKEDVIEQVADYIYDSENEEEQNELEEEEEEEEWKEDNGYDSNDETNQENNSNGGNEEDTEEEQEEEDLLNDETQEKEQEQHQNKKTSLLTKAKLYTSSSNDDGTWTDMGVGVVSIVYETITIDNNSTFSNSNDEQVRVTNNNIISNNTIKTITEKETKIAEDGNASNATEETNELQNNNETELKTLEQNDEIGSQSSTTEVNTEQLTTTMNANDSTTTTNILEDAANNNQDVQSWQELPKEMQSNSVETNNINNVNNNINDNVENMNGVSENKGNTANQSLTNRRIAKLIMVTLDEYHELLFSTPISLEDIYSTENDKILVWDDASIGREMACSFKSTAGCLSIYNEICTYQRVERERIRLQQTPRETLKELLSPVKANGTTIIKSPEDMAQDASELTIALDIDIDSNNNNNALPHYLRSNAEKWSVSAANLSEIYNAATLNTKTFGIFVRDSRNYFAQLAELFTKCKHALCTYTEQQEQHKLQETENCNNNNDFGKKPANTTRIKQITHYMELISKITLTLLQSPYNTEPKIVAQFVEDDLIDICIDIVQYALGKVDEASGFMSFAQRRASFRNPCKLPAPLLKRIHGIYSCTFLKDLLPLSLEDGDGAAPSLLSVLLQRFRYSLIDDIVSVPHIIANSFAQVDHYVPHCVNKTNNTIVATTNINNNGNKKDNELTESNTIDFRYIRDLVAFIHDMSKSIKTALVPLESKENLYSQLVRSGLLTFLSRVLQIALHEYAWLTHSSPQSEHEEEEEEQKEERLEEEEKLHEPVITQTNETINAHSQISSSMPVESSQENSDEEQTKNNITTLTDQPIAKVKNITKQKEEQRNESVSVTFVGSVLQMCCDLLTHCITLRPETLGELIDEVKASSINTPTSLHVSNTNRWGNKRTRFDLATSSIDKAPPLESTCNVHPLESTLLNSLIECVTTVHSSSELQAVYEAINSCCVSLLPVFSFMYDRTTPIRRREIVSFWLSGRWNLESSTAIVVNKNRNRSFNVSTSSNAKAVKVENINDNNTDEHKVQNKKRRLETNNNNNNNDDSSNDARETNYITTNDDDDSNGHTSTSVKLNNVNEPSDNNQLNGDKDENIKNGLAVSLNRNTETTCASFTPPLLRLFDFISFQLKQYICTFQSSQMILHEEQTQNEREELFINNNINNNNATHILYSRQAIERQVQYALKVINVILSSPAAAVSSVESMWYDRHESKLENGSGVNMDQIIALLLSESLLLPAVGSVLRIHHRSACNLQSSLLSFLALLVTRSNAKITKLLGTPSSSSSFYSPVCVVTSKDKEKYQLQQQKEENSNNNITTNIDLKSYANDKKKKDSVISVLESTMLLLLHYAHRGNIISGAVQHLFSVLCDNIHHEKAAIASSSHNSSLEMRRSNSLEFKNNSYYDILHDYQPFPVRNHHREKQHRSNKDNSFDDEEYYENDNDYVDDINEEEEEEHNLNNYDSKEQEYNDEYNGKEEEEDDDEETVNALNENEQVIGGSSDSSKNNNKESNTLVSTLTASALLHQASSLSSERHAKKRQRSHDKYDSVNDNTNTKNEENKKKYKLHKRPMCYQSILSSLISKYGASLARVAPLLHHKLREALTESPTEAQRQLDAESSSIASTLERSFASSSSSSSTTTNIGASNLPREYEAVAFEFGIDPRTGKSPSPPLHTNTEPVPVDDPELALREIQIENEDTMGSLFSDEEDEEDNSDGDKNVDVAITDIDSNISDNTTNKNTYNHTDDKCEETSVSDNNKSDRSESYTGHNNSHNKEENKSVSTIQSNSRSNAESSTDMTNTTNTTISTTRDDNNYEVITEKSEESNTNKMEETTSSISSFSSPESAASPLQQEQEEENNYQEECQQKENNQQMERKVNTPDNEKESV